MPPRRHREPAADRQHVGPTSGTPVSSSSGHDGPVYRAAFLQALMQKQYMREDDSKALYRRVTGAHNDAGYERFTARVDADIGFAHFELRRIKYPADHQYYLGFVNKEADESSGKASAYRGRDGKPDLRVTDFFRMLLERIATADNAADDGLGYVTAAEALNAVVPQLTQQQQQQPATQRQHGEPGAGPSSAPPAAAAAPLGSLSIRDKDDRLAELVRDGWLAHAPARGYCLGPRSFLELHNYISELEDLRDRAQVAPVRQGVLAA